MRIYTFILTISLLFSCKEKTENKNIVYLSPDCGCCHDWVIHMEKNDFPLEKNITRIKILLFFLLIEDSLLQSRLVNTRIFRIYIE